MRVKTPCTWRMKPSPSKSVKAAGKKRGREEATAAATGAAPPMSPPRADPSHEWKKSKVKTEDLLALLNSGFIREKEVDMWRAAAGDLYPMEKAEDEIPMFARFVERGLALPASDFFKGLLGYYGVEYLNLNPNGIFHIAVFVHFCEAFLGIKPHWILFRKFFRVKPQPSANNPRVVAEEAVLPIARLLVPHPGGPKIAPLVDRLREAPSRLAAYVKHMARSIPKQVLAFMKSYFPKAPVEVVAGGAAANCTDEQYSELLEQMAPIAEQVADKLNLQ
jgi:hypothetical protein